MTAIVVRAADSILGQFADKIAAVGNRHAHVAFARALNHEGDKGRTQVKRALVAQTGIKYGMINKGMKTLRATYSRLEYTLIQSGGETNLNLFGAKQGARGVSAAPWNVRRVFRSGDGARASFISPRSGKVLIRSSSASYPLEALYGPNLAREVVKDESRQRWEVVPVSLAARIDHELARLI